MADNGECRGIRAQFLGDLLRFDGVVLIVIDVDDDPAATDAARLVDPLGVEFGALFERLAVHCQRAAERCDHGDPDGLFFVVGEVREISNNRADDRHDHQQSQN
jgi:hypothetical protein